MSIDPSEGGIRRVRRPKDKEELIEKLRARSGGAFGEIRDVLLFAAAVGYAEKRFIPFQEGGGEAIRWETFINRFFAEDLVKMIAVAHSDDKGVASGDQINAQLEIFEGFANGGLEVLQEKVDRLSLEDPLDAVLEVIQATSGPATGIDVLIDLAADPDL